MIGAIIRNDMVENLIVINREQISEMSASLNCEIIDAAPYGLTVGDLRTAAGWTRNAGGEQIVLPLLKQESYDSYTVVANKNVELQEQVNSLNEELPAAVSNEVLGILSGEVE